VRKEAREAQNLPVQTETTETEAQETQIVRRALTYAPPETLEKPVTQRALPKTTLRQKRVRELARKAGKAAHTAVYGSEGANQEYADFCSNLALLLASGHPPAEALIAASRSANPKLQSLCEKAAERAARGEPLSRAFAPWQEELPDVFVPVLAAGEASGTQEEAVRRLVAIFQQGIALKHKFEYSVPGVVSFANAGSSEWSPGRVIGTKPRNAAADWLWTRFPLVSLAVRSLAMARWGRQFAALWNSHVPISEALEISARSAQNAEYAQAFRLAAERTRQGQSLSRSLADTRLLPASALAVLETGDLTGDYSDLLTEFVDILEDDAKERATQLLTWAIISIFLIPAALSAIFGLIFAWIRGG